MTKQFEIDKFKEQFEGMNYSELNREAQKIAFRLMEKYPATWKQELKSNRKHAAIMQLMYAKKESIKL